MSDSEQPLGIMAKKSKKPSVSRAEKAGLTFPVSKLNRHLREARKSKRVGGGASIYLAAVLEYVANEILELSEKQLGKKKKRINPIDVMGAVRADDELNSLLGSSAIFATDRIKNVSHAIKYVPKAVKVVD